MSRGVSPLCQPIVPKSGIGSICIGDTVESVEGVLGLPYEQVGNENELMLFSYPSLTVTIVKGRVQSISAEEGYEGSTPQGVRVGTSWTQLLKIHPDVRFVESKMMWCVPGLNGMSFDIVRPPSPLELVPPPPWYEVEEEPAPALKWIDELYIVQDVTNAFVISISVHTLSCCE